MAFASTISLSSLNGTNGFTLTGEAAGHYLGGAVAAIGDFNGDGVDDIAVFSDSSRPGGLQTGSVYVVFGTTAARPATLNLSTLNGANGFKLNGAEDWDGFGRRLAAGDLDGDGYADLMVAAPHYGQAMSPNPGAAVQAAAEPGLVYVMFGGPGAQAPALGAGQLAPPSGFRVKGPASEAFGEAVSASGDLNGDGLDDLVIGAPNAGLNDQGSVFVLFGRQAAYPQEVVQTGLPAGQGFRIDGIGQYDNTGVSLSVVGDVNGDGIDDLLIGASAADLPGGDLQRGAAFVVYGRETAFPATLNLAALTAAEGFRMTGLAASDSFGGQAGDAGDLNGDGLRDFWVSALGANAPGRPEAGVTYVVFGSAAARPLNFDLAGLNGANGFQILGPSAGFYFGQNVAAVGDVNGDGFDDLAFNAGGGGTTGVYILYGRAGGFSAAVDLAGFSAADGVRITGAAGSYLEVSAAGDLNGDGLYDIAISDVYADIGGTDAGAVHIVYGQSSTSATTGADAWQGTAGIDKFKTLGGDDTLRGLGGNDILDGGPGTDKSLYAASAKDYAWWREDDGTWRVQDLRPNSPEGTDTLVSIEQLVFSDRTIKLAGASNAELLTLAFEQVMRITTPSGANQTFLSGLITAVDGGQKTLQAAYGEIAQRADGTTAVAAMTYQFFLGYAPSKGGFDYLVSPTGPNPNNINSAYFQFFSQENRYINFAVSVGSLGDGKAGFTADYGSLTLRQATAKAYQEIFGGTAPNESFLNLLLDADVGNGMTRKDYFAYYGGDGLGGLGTKAAMVGWLLTEAAKADVGTYARSNNAYLQDLADGAPFLVDMVGVYSQPDWGHSPPG